MTLVVITAYVSNVTNTVNAQAQRKYIQADTQADR